MINEQYNPIAIEFEAQQYWQDNNSFKVIEDVNKEKFYCLTMLPYPSGHLHMGHVRVYTIGDVITRYQWMLQKNVMQPMGWDAFGLPAENAAIKNKIPPADWTKQNIAQMRMQMQSMGFAYDWSRELSTCDAKYYRWEQWLFLRLLEKGLVYKKNAEVNWDPVDQTVLANEQVIDGRGWRSGALVERREISQWFLKITAYAEELLSDLDNKMDGWPDQVKTMQRNWIGKSTGIEIQFAVENESPLTVFTTRPDTLYGVTYLAVALAHPLVKHAMQENKALADFVEANRHAKTAEADIATAEKKGMPLNLFALHPLTGERIPIWVANFVLMEYGAGALMAVPAHDQRDFDFAKQYNLPIKAVINHPNQSDWNFEQQAMTEKGELQQAGKFSGLIGDAAIHAISTHLIAQGMAKRVINYRLRDWGVSRQRYWGAPIPIINCQQCGSVPVPEKDLPVVLPENITFASVQSPLKDMPEFYETTCPNCQGPATRETDTFDTFVESSWYYARYACKEQHKSMLDGRANYWLPVDQYVGGIEHAVLHLLYARFFHKLMRDEGIVNSDIPFTRLLTQGMVLSQGIKMSKSKGNLVDPKTLINSYGADTVRLFMMFAAPPEQNLEWSDSGVEGAHRFLKRLWAFAVEHQQIFRTANRTPNKSNVLGSTNWEAADPTQTDLFRQLYEILDRAKHDYERQQFNTVVSSCMKIFNLINKIPAATGEYIDIKAIIIEKGFDILLRLLAPITPHITHHLWIECGYEGSIQHASWPRSSPIVFKMPLREYVVQVNGKLRGKISIPPDTTDHDIEKTALADPKILAAIADLPIKKCIIVKNKLINIVV